MRALRWTLIGGIWATLALGALVAWYAYDLPDINSLETPTRRPGVTLLDSDGREIASYGELYAEPVGIDEVPPYLVQAIVATEDRRFFEHSGFDPVALARAMVANIRAGSIRQGGSTLTQQLAKNMFLQPDRTLRRKVQELILAFWLEANFSKKQIFTLYINRVYLGAGTYGVEAASRRYFGRSVRDVGMLEAAVLAGLLKAPSRYSPRRDPDAALARARVVLGAMVDAGFLDPETARGAARGGLRLAPGPARSRTARYFADWALERAAGHVGYTGADLVVRTTLDMRLQRIAERRLRALLDGPGKKRDVGQGALVAMAPDGAVRALVGGRDYRQSQYNRAVQARRQPGSAFKLFVYVAAMESGLSPDDRYVDRPFRVGDWRPRNYGDAYRGPMTLREAVARSSNSVAVQVTEQIGRQKVIDAARRLGITGPMDSHPSLSLGVNEVSLLDLTAAYGVIANGGIAVWPHGIAEIRERGGRILFRRQDGGATRVVAPATVTAVNDLLRAAVAWGTGKAAAPGRPAAGKTGTSQDFRDAWFVGYTGELVTGVWMGNDDNAPMARVTGGGLPARLWRDFTADALRGTPVAPLAPARAAPWRDPDAAADSRGRTSWASENEPYSKGD